MEKIDGKPVNVMLEQYQIDKLEKIAKRFNITKAEAQRRIIDTGLDTYAVYEKLGVVKMAEVVKRNRDECQLKVGKLQPV